MKWRQAKKLIKLDGKGKGYLRRWSAWHRITPRQWQRYWESKDHLYVDVNGDVYFRESIQ